MRKINNSVPNVVYGGAAIPIRNNLFYMLGNKHTNGGIGIGKNLEVEGDEVIQLTPNNIKVFSAQKMLGGKSPSELILRGMNPNVVFNAQEKYKDRFNLNDDGSIKRNK